MVGERTGSLGTNGKFRDAASSAGKAKEWKTGEWEPTRPSAVFKQHPPTSTQSTHPRELRTSCVLCILPNSTSDGDSCLVQFFTGNPYRFFTRNPYRPLVFFGKCAIKGGEASRAGRESGGKSGFPGFSKPSGGLTVGNAFMPSVPSRAVRHVPCVRLRISILCISQFLALGRYWTCLGLVLDLHWACTGLALEPAPNLLRPVPDQGKKKLEKNRQQRRNPWPCPRKLPFSDCAPCFKRAWRRFRAVWPTGFCRN